MIYQQISSQSNTKQLVLANRALLIKLLIETYKPVPWWKLLELPRPIRELGGMQIWEIYTVCTISGYSTRTQSVLVSIHTNNMFYHQIIIDIMLNLIKFRNTKTQMYLYDVLLVITIFIRYIKNLNRKIRVNQPKILN